MRRRGEARFGSARNLAPLALAANGLFCCWGWGFPGQFMSWGWRVPFLFSAVLVGVGLWVRLNIAENA